MSKKKNLLVIGDLTLDGARPAPCLNRFLGYANVLKRRGVNCEFAAYDALSIGRLPKFSGNDIKALF
ncbi:MAG: hypothetical protein ACE5GG_03315, partial [Candidatus Omnitrophota bacterium]